MVRKKKSPAEIEATAKPEAAPPKTRKPRRSKALAGVETAATPARIETDVNAGLPGSRPSPPLETDAQTSANSLLKSAVSEHEQIALLAYSFWEARGRRGGSPEEDWYRAEQEFRRQRQSDLNE